MQVVSGLTRLKRLTAHFSLTEFTDSQVADEYLIDNNVPPGLLPNLRRMAQWLEAVRSCELGGHPITIYSGYRTEALNRQVHGSKTSAHLKGLAADIVCPGFGTPLEVAIALSEAPGLAYDQLIYEGRWVHIGLNENGKEPRQEVLTKLGVSYKRGLIRPVQPIEP